MSYTIHTTSLYGQPFTRYSGLASGVNTSALVNAATAAASQNQAILGASASREAAKAGLYATIGSQLGSLDEAVSGLHSAGRFAPSSGTTSNAAAVAITTSRTAQTGTYRVNVTQLAQAQLNKSANFTSANSTVIATGFPPITSGSVRIAVDSGPATNFALTTSTTLSGLAQSINASGLAVKATVVNDANGFRINLASTTTGTAAAFTVTETNSKLAFNSGLVQAAANAQGSVNGTSFDLQSNVSNSLVAGVTMSFALLTGSPVLVSVYKDLTHLGNTVQTFVLNYNAAISTLNAAVAYSQTNGLGDLASNIGIANVSKNLVNVARTSPASATGAYRTLADVGITQNDDGTLSVNDSALTAAIAADASSVANLLSDTPKGLGLSSKVDMLTTAFGGPAGALMRMSSAQNAVSAADKETAANMQYAIDAQAATMQSNFVRYEVNMSELAAQNLIVEAFASSLNMASRAENDTPVSATSNGSSSTPSAAASVDAATGSVLQLAPNGAT